MKDLKAVAVDLIDENKGVEVELTELELAYIGGGIGDVVGH